MKAPKKELKPNPLHQQLKDFATKNADNIGYNKEYVEELSTITPENTSYKGVEALHAPKEADIYDPYEAYINRTELHSGRFDINELNRLRAENQSNWAQAGNAIGQLAVNIVPQIASTVSNMLNVPGWFSAEAAAANPIQEWASGIKEWSQEAMPIYEETPGQMNMADPAWWFSRGEGLIESMTSFAIPGGIAGKAVSAGFKGLGAVTRGKQLARAVLGAEKSAGLLKGMSTLGTAALLNQAEGATIAADVYKNTLDYQLKKNGGNVDLAKKMASEAAATAMSINRINILLNLTSASAFLTPFKQTRNLLKTQGIGSTLSKIGLEAGQESTEELINLVGQKAGEAKGREEEDYISKGLEAIGTMEGFESAFLGALGGAGQTGLVDATQYSKYGAGATKDAEGNRISYAQYQSDLYNQQQQTIKELEDQGVQVSDSLMNVKDAVVFNEKRNKAAAEGNQEEYDRLNNQMFENQALKAFQSGTTEVLENLYKAEAERDVEEVGQEYIDKANQAVKDLQTLESVYNNFEEYANVNDIFFNRANKIRTDRNLGYIQDAAKTNNLELAQLVRNIAGKYEYDVEREVLYKKEGEIQRTETVTEKAPLTYSMSDLENNTGQTEGQKKVYNKFLKEVKKLDAYKREMGYQQAISNGEKILEDNNKEFAELTSPEAQEAALLKQEKVAAIKSAYKEVASTSSRARIQTLMDSIEDPDFKRVAQLRLDALDKAKASNLQQKKKDFAVKTMESKISKASLEELATIQEEINKADPNDISKTAKAALLNKVEFRARQLNNQVLDPQETAEIQDPFADFDSRSPQELENEIELEQKSFDTTIPSDFPNNETEGKDVEKEVENAAVDLLGSDKSLIIGTDENGNLVYNYERSAEGYNRAAFLSREFNQTENVGIVDREEITNDVINSKLLDPDFLLAGTALTMEVDNDYTGEKYDPTSTTREKIAWPLRLKQIIDKYELLGQDYRQSYEYITEVPIKVNIEGESKPVFYVHDNAWYKAENLSASPEEIAIDKEKNFLIRKAIISKGKVNSKVDYKSFGRLFKTADGKKVTVSEAMPDKNLVLGIGKDGAIELSGNSSEVMKDAKILKNNPEDGRLYAIVKVGPNEYMPIPLQRKPINEQTVDSIIFAIEAHLTNDPENPVVKAIAESSLGLDITTTKGLSDYLSQFIYIYPTEGKEGLENALISNGGTKSTLKSSMPLITVTPTGIQFGRPGIQAANYLDANNNKIVQYAINISQNFNKTTAGAAKNSLNLNKLRTVLESGKVLTNANKNTLSKDGNSVIILNAEGDTKTDTYREFVKENYESNILSVNVGTEENPKWAYTIQPTILFDTAFAKIPTQVVASKAQPTVAPTPGISVGKELSPAAKQKLAKLGFSEEILAIMSPADIEIAKTFSSKEDAQDLIKKYTKPTTGPTASVSADIESQKVDIEKRRQTALVFERKMNAAGTELLFTSKSKEFVLGWFTEEEAKKEINAKYDAELAELAALEQTTITTTTPIKTIKKKEFVLLNNVISDFPPDAQALLNNPNPTIEEYNAVISGLEFDLSAELPSESLRKEIESQLADIKNYFEITEVIPESTITPEQEVEANIPASLAENILAQGVDLAEINDTIEALNSGNINEEALAEAGYESTEQALASYQEAKDLYNERAKDTETITLPNGETITITGNDLDINDLAEDEIDDFLVREMTPEQVEAQKDEIDDMIIHGLNTTTQSSLISFLSADIINAALSAKEVGGKRSVKAKEILDKHEESFKILSEFFKKKGLVNRAKHVDAILSQFDKVRRLVNQNMSKFTTGNLSEEVEYDDNQEAVGLERTYADDWTFTVDSKNTASADLKQFFSVIAAQDANGVIKNPLGFNEIIPFDVVYNTLHELLANKPADYETMIDILELNYDRFPWLKSVVDKLEAAPERIQNEFVSDMSKHHIDMQFVMWSKDPNGNYLLQTWSANKSSIENRLRAIWSSNLKGVATQSNLVYIDEDNVYQFNPKVAESLIEQAQEFAMKPENVTNEALATWLGNFGIVLNDETYNDLRKGRYFNNGKQDWNKLFNSSKGIVKVLTRELKKKVDSKIDVENSNILNDTAVKALASLDAANTLNSFSNSFRAGGKTVYSYGNNNFLVNRMRDLTAYDPQNKMFLNPDLIDNLKNISFSRDSLWLNELTSDKEIGDKTRQTLRVGYLSLEALKRLYTKSEDNRKLNNLTAAEHEVTKIGFFQNVSGDVIDKEARRVVDFFYLTMSDKTTMLTIKALAREVEYANSKLSEDNLKLLYKAMVQPEINRIRDKQAKNVKGYEPNYFYFLPSLNKLTINVNGVNKRFLDIVLDKTDVLYDPVVQKAVMSEISKAFNILVTKKLEDWDNFGIGKTIVDEKGKVTDNYTFLDKSYMESVPKGPKGRGRVEYAAADMVFNYLISNAEGSKLFAGDPALYAKFKTKKKYAESINKTVETLTEEDLKAWLNQNLQDTFINITKRLAGDIAPGMELANSMDNVYYQVYLEDKEIASNNVKDSVQREFFEKISSTYAKDYGKIEGSDAQEYTTWQEHLYVMKQLGRLTKKQFDTFTEKLTAQSQGIFNKDTELEYEELGIILQPIKPVYVGNIASKEENVDRRVYVKSSSFPLIPELTSGLQIDKIRKGLEKFETEVGKTVTKDGVPAFVRASFGTANKVGAVKNSVETFDDNGNVVDNFEVKPENTLLLSRANFRIQQDVPYKREKDSINVGTQEAVLLFVNLLNTQVTADKTGKELLDTYNKNYQELFEYNQEKLAEKLGLIQEVSEGADLNSLTSIPTTDVFNKVEEFNNQLKSVSPIKKVSMQEVFAEEVGEDTLERVNFINKNFDKIVEELAKAKVNIFFDENNEFKKCD
jgi:hypothetical protein